jgi:hypothetical protein
MRKGEASRAQGEAVRLSKEKGARPARLGHEAMQRYLRAETPGPGGSTLSTAAVPTHRPVPAGSGHGVRNAPAPHTERVRVGEHWVDVTEDAAGITEVSEERPGRVSRR